MARVYPNNPAASYADDLARLVVGAPVVGRGRYICHHSRPANERYREPPELKGGVVRPRNTPMLKVFCAPARYTQGPHATAQLGVEIRNLGLDGPALIIAGRAAIRLLSETWTKCFGDAGMRHEVFRFGGECAAAEIRRAGQAARDFGARVVIGAGGGKVLDTARAVAADLGLPVVNCPTLASSDAPCSALSVVYTEAGAWEEYRIYRRNPDLVVVDTTLIAQSPVRPLVAGMGDALATWFEARVCVEGGA